jgi:hypothetical protein
LRGFKSEPKDLLRDIGLRGLIANDYFYRNEIRGIMTTSNFTQDTPFLSQFIAFGSLPGLPQTSGVPTLLKAVRSGHIALTIITGHRTNWTPRDLKSSLPTIVLISDDDDNVKTRNPDEWRCAMSAIAWCRTAIVHATAAQEEHYKAAVGGAIVYGRCLIVETDSHHGMAWVEAIRPRRVPSLAFMPFPGGVHPVKTPIAGCGH